MSGLFDRRHRGMATLCAWSLLVAALAMGSAAADEPTSKSAGASAASAAAAARQSSNRLLCVHAGDSGDKLQVHSGAGADQPVIGSLAIDHCGVTLVGKCSGDWCEMALGDVRGWVDTRFIGVYELPESPAAKAEKPAKAVVAKAAARKAPQSASPVARKAVATTAREPWRTDRRSLGRYDDPGWRRGSRSGVGSGLFSGLYFGSCVARVAWWDTLRIRTGPGVGHDEIGGIPAGRCRVAPAGGCRGAWCRIAWNGRIGWVNSYYLE